MLTWLSFREAGRRCDGRRTVDLTDTVGHRNQTRNIALDDYPTATSRNNAPADSLNGSH